jgi:SAM-dependent methyltransferase
MSNWELEHEWSIVRYLVYYLLENLVPAELIPGKDVIDFSAGLGDLSLYMAQQGANSVISTAPDSSSAPSELLDNKQIAFQNQIPASQISAKLANDSADLFVARMVFQFPTQEGDRIDVDGMLAQIYDLLRPGGRLIIASHQYTELDRQVKATWQDPIESYFDKLRSTYADPYKAYLDGLIELVTTIGIPPREGNHGQSGFGLKPLMTADSFIQAGFEIERAAEIEDFTFPIGLSQEVKERPDYYSALSKKVFAAKQKAIQQASYEDKYLRPQVLREILTTINHLHPFVTIPIFAIQARKAK